MPKEIKLDIKKAHVYYLSKSNITIQNVADKYGVSYLTIARRFKKHNLSTKSKEFTRHMIMNDDFFSIIDTEIKAYLLGFFAADGNISKRKDCNLYALKFNIHKDDESILRLYNDHICFGNANICYPKRHPTLCAISIHSNKIGEDLLKLGYDNGKTYTSNNLPEIPTDMTRHFIRGYFDGDGSIYLSGKRKFGGYTKTFSIAAYNFDVLQQIADQLPIEKRKIFIRERKAQIRNIRGAIGYFKSSWALQLNTLGSLIPIYHYLYDDSTYFLLRKQLIFEEAIRPMKVGKVPDGQSKYKDNLFTKTLLNKHEIIL